MFLTRLRLALALATLAAGLSPALASDCVYGTAASNKQQCYPTVAPIDPTTGNPPAQGGGTGGGAVYGPTAPGSAPAAGTASQPVLNGALDSAGKVQTVAPSAPMPTADQNAASTITTPGTAPAKAQGVQRGDGTAIAGDGTDATSVTPPTGGTGIRGWLSGIYKAVTGTLSVTFTNASLAVTQSTGDATKQWGVTPNAASYSGGIALASRIPSSAATTNATLVRTGQTRVYKIIACNTTTTPVRIKFYDTASTPVPGTTAIRFTRPLPAAASAGGLNCASWDVADLGWSFVNGLGYALTTGAADSDTTAVAAGAITDLSVEYQ